MSITIKDVAIEAGVSTATVSRVLNSFPSVSPEAREKVEKAMRKLRFAPDKKAKSLATGKTSNIVFLTSYVNLFEDPHKFAILSGIERSLRMYKYSLFFMQTEKGDISPLSKMVAQRDVDGLVIHGIEIEGDLLRLIEESRLPTIAIGKPAGGANVSWIDNNNEIAGEVAVGCLLSHERKKILYVGGKEADHISFSRLEGVRRGLGKVGLSLSEEAVIAIDPHPLQAEKSIRALYSSPGVAYDGIVVSNNALALGVLRGLSDAKRKVPSEVSVITFDDQPFANFTKPKLSSVSIDVHALGLSAGRLIVDQIRHPGQIQQTYIANPRLVERSSTRYDPKQE